MVTDLIFAFILSLVAVALAWSLRRRGRVFEFPFLASAVFAGFIVPQLVVIQLRPMGLAESAIGRGMGMVLLCGLAAGVGYWSGLLSGALAALPRPDLNPCRLVPAAVIYAAVGSGCLLLAYRAGGFTGIQTGSVTKYLFFGQLVFPALAVLLMAALDRGGWRLWALAGGALVPILFFVVLGGRREALAETAFIVGGALFLRRGLAPSRWFAVLFILGIIVLVPYAREYRRAAEMGTWSELRSKSPVAVLLASLEEGEAHEMRNAVALIDLAHRGGGLEWGTAYWDRMIHRFVPAQFLTREFKESLMVNARSDGYDTWTMHQGSTETGFADAFRQLSFAGAAVFFLVGAFYRALWQRAREGDTAAQIVYTLILTSGATVFTHGTVRFLPDVTFVVAVVGGLYVLALAIPVSVLTRWTGGEATRWDADGVTVS